MTNPLSARERIMISLFVCLLSLALTAVKVERSAHASSLSVPSDPVPCEHVATAGTIEIHYCENINLFVNQLGFMAFEP